MRKNLGILFVLLSLLSACGAVKENQLCDDFAHSIEFSLRAHVRESQKVEEFSEIEFKEYVQKKFVEFLPLTAKYFSQKFYKEDQDKKAKMIERYFNKAILEAQKQESAGEFSLYCQGLERFVEVENKNGHEIEREDVYYMAIASFLAQLDTHSRLKSNRDFSYFTEKNKDQTSFMGVSFKQGKDGGIYISAVSRYSANLFNLSKGERLLKINNIPVHSIQEVEKIKNFLLEKELPVFFQLKKTSGVTYDIQAKLVNLTQVADFSVTQEPGDFLGPEIIQGTPIGDGLWILGWSSFRETTPANIIKVLSNMQESGMKGLIIDMRGNSGGQVNAGRDIFTFFAGDDEVFFHQERPSEVLSELMDPNQKSFPSKTKGPGIPILENLPIVILVDEETVSMGEGFTAAMQDTGRALVIGRQTFGKGIIQNGFPISTLWKKMGQKDSFIYLNGKDNKETYSSNRTFAPQLYITTSQFFSPNGNVIQNVGITPDIKLKRELPYKIAKMSDEERAINPNETNRAPRQVIPKKRQNLKTWANKRLLSEIKIDNDFQEIEVAREVLKLMVKEFNLSN